MAIDVGQVKGVDDSYTAEIKELREKVKSGALKDSEAAGRLEVLHNYRSRYRHQNWAPLISALEDQEKESKSDKERIEFLEKALWQAIREGSFEISDDRVLGPKAWVQFCVYHGIKDHETIEVRPAEYMKELSQVLADEKESLREKHD